MIGKFTFKERRSCGPKFIEFIGTDACLANEVLLNYTLTRIIMFRAGDQKIDRGGPGHQIINQHL